MEKNKKMIVVSALFCSMISVEAFSRDEIYELTEKVKSLNLHNLCKAYIGSAIDNLPKYLKAYDDEFARRNLSHQSCAQNQEMAQLLVEIKYLNEMQYRNNQEDKTIQILNSQLEAYKGKVERRALSRAAKNKRDEIEEYEVSSRPQNEQIIHRGAKGTYTQIGNISIGENGNAFRFGNVIIDSTSPKSGPITVNGNKSHGQGVACIKTGALVVCN
jgi:hypothetical protein